MKSELTFGWPAPHPEATTIVATAPRSPPWPPHAAHGMPGGRACVDLALVAPQKNDDGKRGLQPRVNLSWLTGAGSILATAPAIPPSPPYHGHARTAREVPLDGAARSYKTLHASAGEQSHRAAMAPGARLGRLSRVDAGIAGEDG